MARPDPDRRVAARSAAVEALVAALAAELLPLRYTTVGILGTAWLERVAKAQLAALLALPAPTRAALLGGARWPGKTS